MRRAVPHRQTSNAVAGRTAAIWVLSSACLALSACSAAQPIPIRVVDRPLTPRDGMMEFDGQLMVSLRDDETVAFGERLGGGLAVNHLLYGITDRLTWALPVGLRYMVLDSKGKGLDLAVDGGFLPATSPNGGSLHAFSTGGEVKWRLGGGLWIEQKTALRLLRHFSGEWFAAGWIFGALAQQFHERLSIRLGLAATRALRVTTKTALPRDDIEVSTRVTWVLDRPVDLHWQLGGRLQLGDQPQRMAFTTAGITLRW